MAQPKAFERYCRNFPSKLDGGDRGQTTIRAVSRSSKFPQHSAKPDPGDLELRTIERFQEFIENRGHETGAWRGTIREWTA